MPESEHNINRIDAFFRDSLKSGTMMPLDYVWNNIERKILLGERKKKNGKIVFLKWSAAASIAMLFSLGVYMRDIYMENKELKLEIALRNEDSQPGNTTCVAADRTDYWAGEQKASDTNTGLSQMSHQWVSIPSGVVPIFHRDVSRDVLQSVLDTTRSVSTRTDNPPSLQDDNTAKTNGDSLSDDSLIQSKTVLPDTSSAQTTFALNDFNTPGDMEKQTISRWWLGAFYSLDYTYQNFLLASDNSNAKNIDTFYVNAAHPKYSYSAGIQAGYRLNEKWFFQTGLLYSDKGEKTDYKLADTLISDEYVYTAATLNEPLFNSIDKNYTVNYKYEYWDVPLMIKYRIRKNRLSYFASAGVSANFFFRYQVVTGSMEKGTKQTTTENPAPFRSINYSAIANIGIDYGFSKKISMNLEPTFRYAFTSTVRNSIINTYPYSLGIVTGIKYHF